MMGKRHSKQKWCAIGAPIIKRIEPGGATQVGAVGDITSLGDVAPHTALKRAIGLSEIVEEGKRGEPLRPDFREDRDSRKGRKSCPYDREVE